MIQLSGVTFTYSHGDASVLKRVNLEFKAGEFSLITGPTGSGKSTFLKVINRLIPNFTPGGFSGQVFIESKDITNSKPQDIAELVGYVSQHPEDSFVGLTVIDELAFAMEQLGFEPTQMEERITRIADLVGISDLLDRNVDSLSGGEQQRVAIGAALTAGQKVLLLDEPLSSLDREISSELVHLLKDLSTNHAVTVLIAEHRLECLSNHVDSVVAINTDGSVTKTASVTDILDYRVQPPLTVLSMQLGWQPVANNTGNARKLWAKYKNDFSFEHRKEVSNLPKRVIASISNLSIKYGGASVVAGVNLEVCAGQVTALMGPNGSGKTSCLWAIQGTGPKSSGSIQIQGIEPSDLKARDRLELVAMVPQKATDLLFLETLAEELDESDTSAGVASGSTSAIFERLAGRPDPKTHPRDLSSGQQLALVLAAQLVKDAPLLLLDEPTRGLDYAAKHQLAEVIGTLTQEGKAVVLASHDVEFIAQVCDYVLVLGDGGVTSQGTPEEVLLPGSIYETQVGRVTQIPGLLTSRQIKVRNEI